MERITKRNFSFTRDYIASHLQSWSIAQALSKLQKIEDLLEDHDMTLEKLTTLLTSGNRNKGVKHELHEAAAKIGFIAIRGKTVKVGTQNVTQYGCPHCGYEWLEYSDMPEYPYHCPGCGESLWQNELPEEPAAENGEIISATADDPAEIFLAVNVQLSMGHLTTAFGDIQAMCVLPNRRTLEFTLEKEMLPPENYHYSVQLHCSEKEYDAGCFEETVGVIRSFSSKGIDDDSLKELISTVLMCDKNNPVKLY